jgi:hypothetical protein
MDGLTWVDEEAGAFCVEHLHFVATKAFKGKPVEIDTFERRDGKIGLPRSFAKYMVHVDPTVTDGTPIDVPKCPVPLDKIQGEFFACVGNITGDAMAMADTGVGKTVAGCYLIAQKKVTTLIIVDSKSLARQWVKRLMQHNGFAEDQIGRVGGVAKKIKNKEAIIDYEKPVVIATLQTLRKSKLPAAFWDRFGLAIFDEVHIAAAPSSSIVLGLIPARFRLGLTATPDRSDGLEKAFLVHLGPVTIVGQSEPMAMNTHVVKYFNPDPPDGVWPEDIIKIRDILEEDPARNSLIARLTKKSYDKQRPVVVFAEHINTLYRIAYLLVHAGVPEEDIGFFTGQIIGTKKNGDAGRIATTDEYLDDVLRESPIIMATYLKMQKGIDESRLVDVVEATPRSDLRQPAGRLRRPRPGKPTPMWIKILDMRCPDVQGIFWKSIRAVHREFGTVTGL